MLTVVEDVLCESCERSGSSLWRSVSRCFISWCQFLSTPSHIGCQFSLGVLLWIWSSQSSHYRYESRRQVIALVMHRLLCNPIFKDGLFYDALRPKWMLYKPLDAMFPWLPHYEAWNVVSMATHHWWWDLIIFSVCFYFRRSGSAGSRACQTAQVRLKRFQMILELSHWIPRPHDILTNQERQTCRGCFWLVKKVQRLFDADYRI